MLILGIFYVKALRYHNKIHQLLVISIIIWIDNLYSTLLLFLLSLSLLISYY